MPHTFSSYSSVLCVDDSSSMRSSSLTLGNGVYDIVSLLRYTPSSVSSPTDTSSLLIIRSNGGTLLPPSHGLRAHGLPRGPSLLSSPLNSVCGAASFTVSTLLCASGFLNLALPPFLPSSWTICIGMGPVVPAFSPVSILFACFFSSTNWFCCFTALRFICTLNNS